MEKSKNTDYVKIYLSKDFIRVRRFVEELRAMGANVSNRFNLIIEAYLDTRDGMAKKQMLMRDDDDVRRAKKAFSQNPEELSISDALDKDLDKVRQDLDKVTL